MPRIKLNFITGNAHKLAEVQAILDSTIEVNGQTVDVPEIQGPIEEIAKEKARRASAAVSNIPTDSINKTWLTSQVDQWPCFDRRHGARIPRA
jgi:Xanthosine triphosphate pyrophosphatase